MSCSRRTTVLIASLALVLPAALVAAPAGARPAARGAACVSSSLVRNQTRVGHVAIAAARWCR